MSQETKSFEGWAIVEIMGHQTYAGRVSEQIVGGSPFVRVDVPEIPERKLQSFTKLFGGSSIYCITPVSEEVATLRAARLEQQPVSIYDLPVEVRETLAAAKAGKIGITHVPNPGDGHPEFAEIDLDDEDE